MNRQMREIYEGYRDDMVRILSIEETDPDRLADPDAFDGFVRRIEKLDTLIELYASLMAARRN